MMRGKKAGQTLNEIGKRWYDFDFELERVIYCYLCCRCIKERGFARDLRKLNEKLKFESYQEWKQYICNKYQNYSKEKLTEFSRYLNQRIRNKKPFNEILIILCTVLVSLTLSQMFDMFLNTYERLSIKLVWFISCIIIVLPVFYGIVRFLCHIFDSDIEKNFFEDYKEIIDEIIKS